MIQRIKEKVLRWLAGIPEDPSFVSPDTLSYWLRRERQAKMDGREF